MLHNFRQYGLKSAILFLTLVSLASNLLAKLPVVSASLTADKVYQNHLYGHPPSVFRNLDSLEISSIPVAHITANHVSGYSPLTIEFSSEESYDMDSEELTYFWDFGDGTTSGEANPTKTYTSAVNTTFTVQLTVMDYDGNLDYVRLPISIYAIAEPILGAPTVCNSNGKMLVDLWVNAAGKSFNQIRESQPIITENLSYNTFEAPVNPVLDSFATRYRAYLCPPVSGYYTFYISSSEPCELYLSTTNSPDQKQLIGSLDAQHPTAFRQWYLYPSQYVSAIQLQAGQQYYIEAIYRDNSGGSHMSVGWIVPNANASQLVPIPASVLSPYIDCQPSLSFYNCPESPVRAETFGASALVNWKEPLAIKNCFSNSMPTTITSSHQPDTFFPVGITNVSYTVSAGDWTAGCEFQVIVEQKGNFTFDPRRCYRIAARHSNKSLHVFEQTPLMTQWANSTSKYQAWRFVPIDQEHYQVINIGNDKILSVANANITAGTTVSNLLWTDGDNQKLRFTQLNNGYFKINHKGSDLYLEIENADMNDGARAIQSVSNNAQHQEWKIEETNCVVANFRVASVFDAKSSDLNSSNYVVAPNPADQFININFEDFQIGDKVQLSINNIYGLPVFNHDIVVTSSKNMNLSTQTWTSGTYFLQMVKDDRRKNVKFQIMR